MKYIDAILFSLSLTTCSAQYYWEARADFPGTARWGMACFSIGDTGYMVSGSDGSDLNELWQYDATNDNWTQLASIPGVRRAASAFAIAGKGYVACGLYNSDDLRDDLWEYDPVADLWTQKASLPSVARYGAFGFALNDLGYVGTGNYGTAAGPYTDDLWSYDPVADQWYSKASLPDQPRYGATAFAADGNAYAIGGHQEDGTNTNEMWKYDPTSDSWSVVSALPSTPRTYAITLTNPNVSLVSAGADAGVHSWDSWFYDPTLDSWTTVPAYPGGSGWLGASMSIGGRLFAGLGLLGGSPFNDFWELVQQNEPTAIEDNRPATHDGTITPNPCHPGVALSIALPIRDHGDISIVFVDPLGRQLSVEQLKMGQGVFQCPDLPSGVYTYQIRVNGDPVHSSRLIIL